MVKLIAGNKGTGKTKRLIDMVEKAADSSKGAVVCIERGNALRFDLSHNIRLIDINEYYIGGPNDYYGFIAGLMAGNYDITEIYGDATLRILGGKGSNDFEVLTSLIERLVVLTKDHDLNIILTVSCEVSELPDSMREYCI